MNGIHHQRALDRNEAAQPRIAAFELLHDLAVGHVGHAGAAIAMQIGAEKPQLRHLRHEVQREGGFAIVLLHDGKNFAIDKFARRLAHKTLVIVQQGIDFQEVDTGKARHLFSADEGAIVHPNSRWRRAAAMKRARKAGDKVTSEPPGRRRYEMPRRRAQVSRRCLI